MESSICTKMARELTSSLFWKAVAAEFVGTGLFIFAHHGATSVFPGREFNEIRNALTAGFAIATFVMCTAHISGGHFNPAVSFSFLVFNTITPLRAFFYILAQLSGSTFGAFLIWVSTPSSYNPTIGATVLGEGISPSQGLLIEVVLTFQLVFMIFAVVDDKRTDLAGSKPFAIGLSVIVGILCGINYTGASMNPARSFCSAVVSNTWDDHWIYWVGPIIGGVLGATTYRWILDPNASLSVVTEDCSRCCSCSCQIKMKAKNKGNITPPANNQTDSDDPHTVL